ncbi:MAG: hypothetical protein LBS45_08855 [Synergistaceae bacterium]|jgi:hypothetical protein|nr:hypothetical protein [Synergistaceae bacterium]
MTALLLYIALTLALFAPEEMINPRWWRVSKRDAAASLLALTSACALPWSGVSLLYPLGLGSEVWLPSIIAAVVIAPERSFARRAGRVILIASIIAASAAMSLFMSKTGVPGKLFSIEGYSMILRLCGFTAALAMCLAAVGLVWSFIQSELSGAAFKLIAYSFSGFLAITFAPIDFSIFGWQSPRMLAMLTPASLFILACLVSFLFARRAHAPKESALLWRFAPAALTAAGCFLLAIQ